MVKTTRVMCLTVMMVLLLAGGGLAQGEISATEGVALETAAHTLPQHHSLLHLLNRGGPVMYPLYLCSIFVVTFWIERVIRLRRDKVMPPVLLQRLAEASPDTVAETHGLLLGDAQTDASPLGRILKAGMRKAGRPLLEIEKAMEDAGAKEVIRLQRNNKVLSAVATIAPLLGLLGTVTGLMRSFMTVATTAEALGRTELLAAGIYEALVATAAGLAIAIPSMALYFYYQERVDKLVGEIDDLAADFVETLATDTNAEAAT